MISSSGASLGGFAADEWAYRDAPSGFDEESLSLEYRLVFALFWCARVRWCLVLMDRRVVLCFVAGMGMAERETATVLLYEYARVFGLHECGGAW